MTRHWQHPTSAGLARITHNTKTGRYHAWLGDEDLGNYAHPQQAVDDLCGGHTFWPSSAIDPSTLGLPEELSEWEQV